MRSDVNLVVVGTAPTGTTFTVHYSCVGGPNVTGDMSFDETGNAAPPGSNYFNSLAAATCTISETTTGGASVAFQCASSAVNVTCDPSGTSVTFAGGNSAGAIFTVTNTFAAAEVPAAVTAPANLTG